MAYIRHASFMKKPLRKSSRLGKMMLQPDVLNIGKHLDAV